MQRVSVAVKRASNSLRPSSISSSLAPGWSPRMDSRNHRRAVSDNSVHWRNPSCVVRGNRTVFISAFTSPIRRNQRGTFLDRFIRPTPFKVQSVQNLIPLSRITSAKFFLLLLLLFVATNQAGRPAPGCRSSISSRPARPCRPLSTSVGCQTLSFTQAALYTAAYSTLPKQLPTLPIYTTSTRHPVSRVFQFLHPESSP